MKLLLKEEAAVTALRVVGLLAIERLRRAGPLAAVRIFEGAAGPGSRPAALLDLSRVPLHRAQPWFRSATAEESRCRSDFDGPAPRRHPLEGGRTHSPGAALPSLVWLSPSLGNPRHIFGRARRRNK